MIFRFPVEDKHILDIKRINEYDTKASAFYLISAACTGTGYVLRPLVTFIVFKLMLHQSYIAEMPLKTEFLYDISKSPAYELTYLLLICAVSVSVVMSVSN
jgi:hypothetical protein